jgi:HAD superfamily hydrolase (TIGR01484 family)
MSDKKYQHLFFDMDQTIAPSRKPIETRMYDLLNSLDQDIIIVSGQEVAKIAWQSNELPAYLLGQNGNHAVDLDGKEIWNVTLSDSQKREILDHINELTKHLEEEPNPEWKPIEDRGAQITFSPVGNVAPVEVKQTYDPDKSKRFKLMDEVPFESDELVVKIGGSTSFDYIHKDRHKGANVKKFIEYMNWNPADCVYYGDGLMPGGNDESVIGVIDTIPVDDHADCFKKLNKTYAN